FELAGVAFVGSGTAASAAGMDKVLMKGLFAAASLPQADYRVLRARDRARAAAIVEALGWPLFVKPANLGSSVGVTKVKRAEELGLRAFEAVDAAGYARVDFLMERRSGRVLVNEINTIPGFTSISMFPKLWEASGIPYDELLGRLVELGFERHRERALLRTDYR